MLCFKMRNPKQNTVARLKSNISTPPKFFWPLKYFGLSTPLQRGTKQNLWLMNAGTHFLYCKACQNHKSQALQCNLSSTPFQVKLQNSNVSASWQVLEPTTDQRWALDWTWIGLDPDYSKFCYIWIGSGLEITSKFRIRTWFGLN